METYSLLIVFLGMVAVWWWAWAPWKKRGDTSAQDQKPPPERKLRR